MSLLFNMLSRVVITFLPRSKCLLISWLQSPSAVILELKKIKSVTVSIVSPSICHEVMGPDDMVLVFWMLNFKSVFSLSSFTFIKRLFSSSLLSVIRVMELSHKKECIWGSSNEVDEPRAYYTKWSKSEREREILSCLENPMDRGAWWAAVHGVAKRRRRLSDFTFTFHFHALEKEMATHSSILAWRIPGTGKPGGLPSMGSHRVRHYWSDLAAYLVCS